MEVLIAEVRYVVTCVRQPLCHADIGTHVNKEASHQTL